MDPSITTAIAIAVESAINHALQYDPASQARIRQLTDVMAGELTSPGITFFTVVAMSRAL